MKGLPSLEVLEEVHNFPGPYTFKVFGSNTSAFVESVERVVEEVTGGFGEMDLSTRSSSAGNHVCVTVNVHMQTAHQVQAMYVELAELDDLRMLL